MTDNNTMMRQPGRTDGQGGATENYRRAFLLTLIALIAIAGVAAWLWWRSPFNPMAPKGQSAVAAHVASETPQPTTEPTVNGAGSLVPSLDAPIAPIQLSPERMQSIGVKIG